MNVICYPSQLSGTVAAIPSKSDAHRKLICAARAENPCTLPLAPPFCDDIAATLRCLKALGAAFTQTESGLQTGAFIPQERALLDCGESGSTLRFLLPVAMTLCPEIRFTGAGRLPERPIDALTREMSAHGVQFSGDKLPLTARGRLTGGDYTISGNVSSQFLSGLLMALPACDVPSTIRLTTPLQSAAYVDMTLRTLREFNAKINVSADDSGNPVYQIVPGALRAPHTVYIDGDWSNAAFWLTAASLRGSSPAGITVTGLRENSTQGDRAIMSVLQSSGAKTICENNAFTVFPDRCDSFTASMAEIPDLLPILAVKAAFSDGTSAFVDAARLRLKESDRLAAVAKMLNDLGGIAEEAPDKLFVTGGQLRGGTVDGMNDHRIVMAAAIAATCCEEPVVIQGAEAVNKSYPGFFDDYRKLGGRCEKLD